MTRKVRDARFWGVPVGTPIAPGMKPRTSSPAKSAVKAMADPGGSHWPGGDWRKPESGGGHTPGVLPGNRAASGPSSSIRGPGAPGSWPGAEGPRASRKPGTAAARFNVGASRGREAAPAHRAAAAQHITGGDIVKVNHSGQELKVVRAREFRGNPGYDLQTGSSSEHTTWFPAAAVSKGGPQSLHDVVNQRGVPEVAKRTPAPPKTARGTFSAAHVSDVSRTLNTAGSRAAAEQAVAKLSGPQLRSVAKANNVSIGSGWSVARIREQLVESLAGRRLDSKALGRR